MSHDILLFNDTPLPPTPEEIVAGSALAPSTPPSMSISQATPPVSPMRQIHRLLRGREKLAIALAVCGAIIGAAAGWLSQKPLWISNGVVWIKPVIPSLMKADQVMPFYNNYILSQEAILTSPRVLERAVQSPDWKKTGLPSDATSVAMLKQNLDVNYPKNSENLTLDYTDERYDVAQAAVQSVIHAYHESYADANGEEMQNKLDLINKNRDGLNTTINAIQSQIHTLTEKHGSDDLSVVYNTANEHLLKLKDETNRAQMTLESADASLPKDGDKVDPTRGLTLNQIAAVDPLMHKYLADLDQMQFDLGQMRTRWGEASPQVIGENNEIKLQQQRIDVYATEFRKHFFGGTVFNFDQMMAVPLTKEMYAQIKQRAGELKKQYDAEAADFKSLSEDWTKILDLKQQLERARTDKDKFDKQYDELEGQAAMGGTLEVISDGDTPIPAPDKRKQFAFVGFVGGGALPIGLLMLIGVLDGRFRYSEEAGNDMSGMTLLGILPNLPDRLTDPAQAATAAHCVHQIRTMLQINAGEDRNVFAITSASPGDGKTSLTLALGLSFAASGSRTLLIDCDLVGAGLSTRLNMGGPEGVLEAMTNRDLLPYIQQTDIADLAMLPVGQAQAHHAGMFSPTSLRRLLMEAKKHFEIILIDSGPVLGSIEATPVCAAADGVILCVSRGQQRPLVEKAIEHLTTIGAMFAGVVFNRAQARDFARSISGISLRSITRQHAGNGALGNGHANGNGNGAHKDTGVKAFGPVVRAVATSVKKKDEK